MKKIGHSSDSAGGASTGRLLVAFTLWSLVQAGAAAGGGWGSVGDDGMWWKSHDVHGSVHTVHQNAYPLRYEEGNGWVEGLSAEESIFTYNRDRTFVETVHLRPHVPGLPAQRFSCFVRDEKNRIVQFYVCDRERRPADGSRTLFRYSERGLVTEERIEKFEKSGVVAIGRDVYEYDSMGRETSWRQFGPDGALILTVSISYDLEKNLSVAHRWTGAGQLEAKEIRSLDAMGRIVEVTGFDQNGEVTSVTRLGYDDHGRRMERWSSGRGVEVKEIDAYAYDAKGNWIRRERQVIRPTGEERTVIRRVIEYFPE
jgi:hypothetical protein